MTNKAMLALVLGFALAVAATANSQMLPSDIAEERAEQNARRAGVVVPQRRPSNAYIKDSVRMSEYLNVYILEDHKRNRLCYIARNSDAFDDPSISCGPLHP